MGLCRAALRDHDERRLDGLSKELSNRYQQTGDGWWQVVKAHMNAEMASVTGQLARADELYDESPRLSESIGRRSMVATECLNKSFVAVARGNTDEAMHLLSRHFEIRNEVDDGDLNPYGLIGLASLLASEAQHETAALVCAVLRRLLAASNTVPDPPDEAPLLEAEQRIGQQLDERTLARIEMDAARLDCRAVVRRTLVATRHTRAGG